MRKQTSVRVEEKFYREAMKVFKKMGMSFGDAVNLFLAKVALEKRLPFEIGYSDELLERVNNVEKDRDIEIYESAEELFEKLGI